MLLIFSSLPPGPAWKHHHPPFKCLIHAPFRASSLLVLFTPLCFHWWTGLSGCLPSTHAPLLHDERPRTTTKYRPDKRRLLLLARPGSLLEGALPLRESNLMVVPDTLDEAAPLPYHAMPCNSRRGTLRCTSASMNRCVPGGPADCILV